MSKPKFLTNANHFRRDNISRLFFRILLVFIGVVFIVTWSLRELNAQEAITLTPETQFEFADSLYQNKDYPAAKIEFQKFLFFFPKEILAEKAQFKIGLSLFHQRDYENALHQFAGVLDQYGPTETGIESGLFVSRCHMALKDVDSAVNTLHALIKRTDIPEYHQKIYYQLAWTYVETGDFQNAYVYFEKINISGNSDYPVGPILQVMNDSSKVPSKSPLLAGCLSIIPGGGYAYCGRYSDALISLVINSACAAAAYESFDNNLNVLGGIIAAVGIGFYGGNIYGSVSNAHKYNKTKKIEFIKDLKNQFNFDLMTGVDSDGVNVMVQRRF
jgi:tetratricopeptide (TPR) repeat protein